MIRGAHTEVRPRRELSLYSGDPRFEWTLRYINGGWIAARGRSRSRVGGYLAALAARFR
jgi:hypothetical protein